MQRRCLGFNQRHIVLCRCGRRYSRYTDGNGNNWNDSKRGKQHYFRLYLFFLLALRRITGLLEWLTARQLTWRQNLVNSVITVVENITEDCRNSAED